MKEKEPRIPKNGMDFTFPIYPWLLNRQIGSEAQSEDTILGKADLVFSLTASSNGSDFSRFQPNGFSYLNFHDAFFFFQLAAPQNQP